MPADASSASRPERHQHTRSQALSPSTFTQSLPEVHVNGRSSATAAVEDEAQRAKRMDRLADLDQTVERDSEDVIDDLVRASKKGTLVSPCRTLSVSNARTDRPSMRRSVGRSLVRHREGGRGRRCLNARQVGLSAWRDGVGCRHVQRALMHSTRFEGEYPCSKLNRLLTVLT